MAYLSGFPTVSTVVLVVVVSCMLMIYNLDWSHIDIVEITDVNSHMRLINSFELGLIRFVFFATILISCIIVVVEPKGLNIQIFHRGATHKFNLRGFERYTMFTVWCWVAQGIYFGLAAYISLLHNPAHFSASANTRLFTVCKVFYEVSFSMAYLVTIIVTFILIPFGKARSMPVDNFFRRLALMMHNLNVMFMATEVALNRLSFDFDHIPFVVLFGCSYIIFSWYWYSKVGVFWYFFLDYERDYAVLWQLALLFAVGAFFGAGWVFSYCIQGGVKFARLILILITFGSMKVFKDKAPDSVISSLESRTSGSEFVEENDVCCCVEWSNKKVS